MGQWPENRLRASMPIGDLEGKRDFSFTDIRGFQILNTTGHKVGTVKDVFVDPNTLEPCFAFLSYEKGPSIKRLFNSNLKHLLVPWEELHVGPDFVQTRWTEDELTPQTQAEQDRNLGAHASATGGVSQMSGAGSGAPGTDMVTSYDSVEADEEPVAGSRSL